MPRIPLVRTPQLNRSGDNYVPVTGAPGINWRADNGLQQLGEGFERLGHGVGETLSELAKMAQQKQAADDADNLGQIGLEGQIADDNLTGRMQKNPNDFANFAKYNEEEEGALSDRVKPYLEKLSPDARKRADLMIAQTRQRRKARTEAIAFQADVTVKRERSEFRINWKSAHSDFAGAREEIETGIRTGIFGEHERERLELTMQSVAENSEVEKALQADPAGTLKRLAETTEAGTPANWPAVGAAARAQWRIKGETLIDNKFKEDTASFVADIQHGNAPSEEELDRRHLAGEIDDRTYLTQKPYVRNYWKGEKAEAAAKATAAREKDTVMFKANLDRSEVPVSPQDIAKFRSAQYEAAAKAAGGDAKTLGPLLERIEAKIKGDDPFKQGDAGGMVKGMIDQMMKNGEFAYKGDENEAAAADRMLQFYGVGRQLLREKKSVSEIQTRLEEMNRAMMERRITSAFNNSGRMVSPETHGKVFDSRKPDFVPENSIFADMLIGGPIPRSTRIKAEKIRKEGAGWVDRADIVEAKPDKDGRTIWKLKDGRKVYADEYANE